MKPAPPVTSQVRCVFGMTKRRRAGTRGRWTEPVGLTTRHKLDCAARRGKVASPGTTGTRDDPGTERAIDVPRHRCIAFVVRALHQTPPAGAAMGETSTRKTT